MENARQQIVDSIKNNSNILLTVSTDPSVDELSAALGLTIILNNIDKRATAIFSGAVPPAINFLEPAKTFESSADSLRDFIIALDKEKADHLRYKVDGDLVKIFITPYKTTLGQSDLEFSQGDYNVELVLALGVKDQNHLDKAIEANGKILHDATVVTVSAGADGSSLGSLDWHDEKASSLCEMVAGLADGLKTDQPIFDEQIATALLTGIVSATDRFSNDKTSSRTMTVAAQLMAAGANQQLIAAKLEEAHDIAPAPLATTGTDKGGEGRADNSELTIERSGRTSSSKTETNEEPASSPEKELESQLANLTAPTTGTLADIEKELQQAAAVEQPATTPDVLTATSDTTMPGFEAPQPAVSTPLPELALPGPEPQLPPAAESTPPPSPDEGAVTEAQPAAEAFPVLSLPPELTTTTSPPEIINQHGTIATQPELMPPINSIQNNPLEGEPMTVDPFTAPTTSPTPAVPTPEAPMTIEPLTPDMNASPGTSEGAAALAAPVVEPVVPEQPPAVPVSVPELPPLPPLPTDASLPPLPPPPPPPPTFPTGGTMPSGAVSGDVFGDGNTPAPTTDQTTTPPPEPGQFKIPGSPS